jgi:RimJ/RimL family protein N-acetyltransferase
VPLTEQLAMEAAAWFRDDPVGQAEFGGFYGAHPRWWALTRSDVGREGFIAVDAITEDSVGFLDTEHVSAGRVDIGMYVRRRYRRQGWGRSIVSAGIDWARAGTAREVVAAVRPDNVASLRCCEAAGLCASRVNDYGETVLTLDLRPASSRRF